ncbi:ShlB/FhaC/HecB family hemolysin secretion/activation protein [Halomonas binhaiensis]|uniref:ShlB/FhaC/HecB family hemolysin secretion/activation protein n=1 Tax=Halomonas binhaiensis TaxID=2562282 RepID=A0A856QVP0_9GAMM|nr:ShlB/FhaC/HecB family hemolysin secretion/activation protein [Halomonas binhaiensis]QEM83918.2 ShlB/FhaC/HecB family hemolysin secretion/activation protein [Halomonas binhaiensis]
MTLSPSRTWKRSTGSSWWRLAWLPIAILTWPVVGAAQQLPPGATPPAATNSLNRNFLRDDQRRLLEEQREKLEQLERLPGREAKPSAPVTPPSTECVQVDDIDLNGVTRFNAQRQQAWVAPYEGRCLTVEDFNALLGDITNAYVDQGFVTTRAYLAQQDLTQRQLKVVVFEGRIEALESTNSTPTSREISMASPVAAGDVLNLRDLEQLVDQLGRLPSRQSTMELVPGEEVGGSRVQLDSEGGRPVRFSLGRNNDGTEDTGEQQWALGFEWDSPLGLADQLRMQWGHDVTGHSGIGSRDGYIDYSVPFGYWNFSYSYTESAYDTVAEADGFLFDYDGVSQRHRLMAERLLHRDQVSKTSASVALSRVTTRNNIDGQRIDLSSQTLADVTLGFNHGRRIGSALVNADLQWSKGLRNFGAQHDENKVSGEPKAQFEKTMLTLSAVQPFSLFDQSLRFTSLAYGQWSDDVLYSPYRLTIGGLESVRGFKEQSLSGDSGAYWRNEVSWHLPLEMARPVFHSMELSLGYDMGVIHHGDHNPELHGRMTGYAVGLGLQGEHLAVDVSTAHSLERPEFIEDDETPVYFNVTAFL